MRKLSDMKGEGMQGNEGGQEVKLSNPREAISFPRSQPFSENTSIPRPQY